LLLSADYRVGTNGAFKIGLNEVEIGLALPLFAIAMARDRLATPQLTSATIFAEMAPPARAVQLGFLDAVSDDSNESAIRFAQNYTNRPLKPFAISKSRLREPLLQKIAEVEKSEG
jgi:enoyl-CoA hydratase